MKKKWRSLTAAPVFVLLGIAVIALLLRLTPLLRKGVVTNPDSASYIELSQGLNHGCGFARWTGAACGSVETFRTPGYPLFLAATSSLRAAITIQEIAGATVCLLMGLYVRKCWGLSAGIAAELLVALDIPSILFGGMVLSDILFQAMVTVGTVLGLWIVTRGRNDRTALAVILVAATVFGSAILVRPIGIVLPVFAALPVFLLPRISWHRSITIALLAFSIPP